MEGGKPDALTRRSGDIPTPKDARKTPRNITLLPREKYWRTAIQLRTTETRQIQGKNAEELEKASRENTQFQEIRKALQANQKELRVVALGLCQWRDILLWYNNRIWVLNKEKIRTEIIRRHHDIPQAGHGGTVKTTALFCRTYYWPQLRHKVKRYVKNCNTCQRIKSTRHAPYGQLQPLEVPDKPWKSIAMDFITDLPESETNNVILVVIDRLTKMSHFIPCRKNMNTKQFKMLFMNNIYRLHRLPADITTDRDTLFTSELWKETTKQSQIERKMSTAFHPQTDGQTERTNAMLEQYLRA